MIISLLIREEACESFNSSLENTKILDISISSRECYKLYHLENTLYAYLSIPVIELPSDWLKSSALIGIGFDFKTSYFKVFTTFPIILISYAPVLFVVLAYLQEARPCKCRTKLVCEEYSCKI